MRIAAAGIATESCTFSPLKTRLEDFTVLRGEALLEAAGYRFLARAGAEILPIFHARALPGGPVAREAFGALKAEFLAGLRAACPLDGLYLDMHGAMNTSGMDDAEDDWLAAARRVVGPRCLIAASFDLHANLSGAAVSSLDILTGYRTAPHLDVLATRERAFALLLRCLREGLRPEQAWLRVPVLLPGERTSTEAEPAAGLYASLAQLSRQPGLLDASIFVGYLWADEPRAGASVVVTGLEREACARAARKLAQRYWDLRGAFTFNVPAGSLEDCIGWALAAPEGCIFISDSGDNPTAGGVGDMPVALERLLARRVEGAVLGGIADAAATDALYAAGVGAELALSLGGRLDPDRSKPLPVSGRVRHLRQAATPGERQAVFEVNGVKVIVTRGRQPFHHLEDFRRLGVEPLEHKLIVVKMGYLVPDLRQVARRAFLALSPGAVDQDIPRLPFTRLRRPLYPLDPAMSWAAGEAP